MYSLMRTSTHSLPANKSAELSAANAVYATNIQDLILVALSTAYCSIANTNRFDLYIESHGRHAFRRDLDVGRTVGWFTSVYPISLSPIRNSKDIGAIIMDVRRKMRAIKDGGLSYGAIRWMSKENKLNRLIKQDPRIGIAFK